MKITLIAASTRADAQSRKVADYLAAQLTKQKIENILIDLNEKRLPLYDDTGEGDWKPMWEEMSKTFSESDGFIFVSPEWDGMFSVGLHNMFHYVDKELADKPVLLVGVSDGRGGRYPLVQMKIMGQKNKRFVIIPENLYFDHIKKTLVEGVLINEISVKRTDYALKVLVAYAKALSIVRQSGVIDYKTFPSGW